MKKNLFRKANIGIKSVIVLNCVLLPTLRSESVKFYFEDKDECVNEAFDKSWLSSLYFIFRFDWFKNIILEKVKRDLEMSKFEDFKIKLKEREEMLCLNQDRIKEIAKKIGDEEKHLFGNIGIILSCDKLSEDNKFYLKMDEKGKTINCGLCVSPNILASEDNFNLIKKFEKAASDGKSAECSAIKNSIEDIADSVEKRVNTGLVFFENIEKENRLFDMLDKAAKTGLQNISKLCTQSEKVVEFSGSWSFVDEGGKERIIDRVKFDFRCIVLSVSLLPRISFHLTDGEEYVFLEQKSKIESSCMQSIEESLRQRMNFLNSNNYYSELN